MGYKNLVGYLMSNLDNTHHTHTHSHIQMELNKQKESDNVEKIEKQIYSK